MINSFRTVVGIPGRKKALARTGYKWRILFKLKTKAYGVTLWISLKWSL